MPLKPANQICPGCQEAGPFIFIRDAKNDNGEFSLYECPNCGCQYFSPFKHPGGNWYEHGDVFNQKEEFKPRSLHCYHEYFLNNTELKPGFTALDLGCGTGEFLDALQKRGGIVYGVDIDQEAIKIAEHFFKLKNISAAKIEDFFQARPIEKFDFISMFEVFEHTDNPLEIIDILKESLKDNGHLIMSLPSRDRIFPNLAIWDFPFHHLSRWNGKSLTKVLAKHGLRVTKIKYIHKYGQLFEIFLDMISAKLQFKKARRFKVTNKQNQNKNHTSDEKQTKLINNLKNLLKKIIYQSARFTGVKLIPGILASLTYPILLIFKPKSGVIYLEAIKLNNKK